MDVHAFFGLKCKRKEEKESAFERLLLTLTIFALIILLLLTFYYAYLTIRVGFFMERVEDNLRGLSEGIVNAVAIYLALYIFWDWKKTSKDPCAFLERIQGREDFESEYFLLQARLLTKIGWWEWWEAEREGWVAVAVIAGGRIKAFGLFPKLKAYSLRRRAGVEKVKQLTPEEMLKELMKKW